MRMVCYLIVIFFSLSLKAQSWRKVYQKGYDYGGFQVDESYDKGFLVVAYSGGYTSHYDGVLLRTDIDGNLLWQKYIGDTTYLTAIKQAKDGGFFLGGATYGLDSNGDAFITRLNACGEQLWSTIFSYPDAGYEWVRRIKEMPNGDVLLIGVNYDANQTIFFCLNENGKFKWKFANTGFFSHILLNQDNTIMLTGDLYTYIPGGDSSTVYEHSQICKLDTNGRLIWAAIHGKDNTDMCGAFSLVPTPDKGYLSLNIARDSAALQKGEIMLVKYDWYGKEQWVKRFGDSTMLEDMMDFEVLGDSTYVILVNAYKKFLQDNVIRLVKVSASGQVLSSKDFPWPYYAWANSMTATHDHKAMICAAARDSTNLETVLLMKVNDKLQLDSFYTHTSFKYDYKCPDTITSGDRLLFPKKYNIVRVDTMHFQKFVVITGAKEAQPALSFKVFPNPSSGAFNVKLEAHPACRMRVINTLGITVYQQSIPENEENITFSFQGQAAGMYYLLLESDGKVIGSRAIMKQ